MDMCYVFFVGGIIGFVNGVFYANVTHIGCIDFDVGFNLNIDTITILKYQNTVLQSIYTGADDVLLTFGNFTGRIINYNINRPQGEISFCINSTTKYDGGDYYYERSNEIKITERFYVLDKPTQPDISVISNGIVNFDKGQLECKSLSTSMPSDLPLAYYWKINQTVIVPSDKYSFIGPGNSQLIVDVVRNDRFNMFLCYSAEQQGMTSYGSTIMRIDPKHSPMVTIQPNIAQYRIVIHSRFIIRCVTAEAYPNVVSYKWFKDYSLISGQLNDSYIINNVSRTDDGIYNCTASNGYGTNGSASISLIVLYGPIVKAMSIKHQEEGRNITVNCDVQSNPTPTDHNVTWTKSANFTFRQTGLQLIMPYVNRVDHGTFICTVRIMLQPTDGPSVIRTASSVIQINVLYGPLMEPMSLRSQVVGRTMTVKCDVKSNPTPTNRNITWTKFGNSTFSQTGLTLKIPTLNMADKGSYICTARITFQPTGRPPVMRTASAVVQIQVLYGPSVKQMSMISQEEGGNVTVNCDVQSNPTPTDDNVTWTKSGNSTFRQNGLQLTMSYVNRIDHGTFTCSVTITLQPTEGPSVMRSASESVQINILCAPLLNNHFPSSPNKILREIGTPLNITVYITALPIPTISWTFQQLGTNTKDHKDANNIFGQVMHSSSVYVAQLDSNDFGYYSLTSTNNLGTLNMSFSVKQESKPKTPAAVLAICESTSAFIIWKSTYNGGSEQKFHIQYWEMQQKQNMYKASSNISDPGEHFYMHIKLDGLSPGKTYGFHVIAKNYIGQSISQNLTCSMDSTFDRGESSSRDNEGVYKAGIASLAIGILVMLSTVVASVVFRIRKQSGKEKSRLDIRTCVKSQNTAFQDAYETIEQKIEATDPNGDVHEQLGSSLGTYEDLEPNVKKDSHVYQQLQECQKGNVKKNEYANMNF